MIKQRLVIFLCILGLFLPAYVSAGSVLSSHKYAWSNNVGYINFENVIVSDSALSGSAWSANKGFIKFNPAQSGVSNDGTGNLSGSAWGEQLGWIDFNNVSIDSNGQFSGTATGELVGTITFDCPNYCDVQTDWRRAAVSPVVSSGGGGGGGTAPGVDAGAANVPSPAATTPNDLSINAPPVEGSSGVTVARGQSGEPVSLQTSTEQPALFDIISEPVQSTRWGNIPFVVFSIIAGILLAVFVFFSVRKIRVYVIARRKKKEEEMKIVETQKIADVSEAEIPGATHNEIDNQNESR